MNLRTNINKIHSDLTSRFNDVSLLEKSNVSLGNYFEISIVENNKNLKIILSKKSIDNDNFSWSYFSNPDNELSTLVERQSNVNNFVHIVEDIFEKNRFDSEYLEKIK
jgi:hypothetical protein